MLGAHLQGDYVGCAGTFIAQEMYFAVIVDTFVAVSKVLAFKDCPRTIVV